MTEVADRDADDASEQGIDALTGQRLGAYRVMRELGRGSNGVVYEALRDEDHQRVALKVLPANITLNAKTVARFKREAQAAAGLKHPGIVQVREISESGGTHFFAMDYVEGVSLDRYAEARELPVREAVRLIRDAALALHHAHQHGVIHRDVKPSNLLVRADGTILVTDFGLARLEKSATLTSTDAIVGTPRYMSPEQILAEKGQVDQRTDVYALAVTLYEILTGAHPFEGDSVQSFLRNVLEAEPQPPRKVNRLVPRSLETIVLKAMDRDLARRYQTAEDLASDLDRFLTQQPVQARRPPILPRMIAFVRRHRVPALAGALGLMVLTAVTLVLMLKRDSAESSYDTLVSAARTRLTEIVLWSPEEAPARSREIEALLERAVSLRGRRPEAHLVRARLRCYQDRFDEAATDLEAARSRGASSEEMARVRAFLALHAEDYREAIVYADVAAGYGEPDAELLWIRGAARFAEGDVNGAHRDLSDCLKLQTGHVHAARLMRELEVITGGDPENVSNLTRLLSLLSKLGQAGEEGAGALATITDLVSRAASASGLAMIGRDVFQQVIINRELASVREEEAREEIRQATAEIAKDPSQHRAFVRRGRARVRLGDLEQALRDFQDAIESNQNTSAAGSPTDWEPFFWLAFIRVTAPGEDLWDGPLAAQAARYAVGFAPEADRPRAEDVYAEVLFRIGRKTDAIDLMTRLEQDDPERAEYYRRRRAYFQG